MRFRGVRSSGKHGNRGTATGAQALAKVAEGLLVERKLERRRQDPALIRAQYEAAGAQLAESLEEARLANLEQVAQLYGGEGAPARTKPLENRVAERAGLAGRDGGLYRGGVDHQVWRTLRGKVDAQGRRCGSAAVLDG